MEAQKKKLFVDEDPRSFLKNQHRKVYSICRLFTNHYKEHQSLVANILAVACRCIGPGKTAAERKSLYIKACINMAVLHALSEGLKKDRAVTDKEIQFKSPDYQKSMLGFRTAARGISDLEKILLFLHFEKVAPEDIPGLTGLAPSLVRPQQPRQAVGQRFIPYLKEKIIWS
ncbi:MAG: hypothetical protein Q8927_15460 [Bacteroidota bacterium]|nr:hypothetical protein [Bacteroidota bacterium]MDP4217598.1 hypothetical protein [Bacteroidota bacterium]MDP4245903.1 hypothetical protein [Bacteroidota bacterium]MDP4255182.1 hypothetical protein [Bacteroidota bacterium]MDP4259233.1 hypothetical protein [Bacteroidota bacterium]